MKVLVIGATGMLAKPVVKQMLNNNFELRLFSRSVEKSMFEGEFEVMRGDIFNESDLEKALSGCNAVHINLSGTNQHIAAKKILNIAKIKGVNLVSTISGATVCEENRWSYIIDDKFKLEQEIINSGIPYLIFRPSWFFESLRLMVRGGKATIIGKQKKKWHWIAADDYANMVINAYNKADVYNNIFQIYGKDTFTMKDVLEKYIEVKHPEIKKISSVPPFILKLVGYIKGLKFLRETADLFSYFEKVDEPPVEEKTYKLLGEPRINFQRWLDEIV